MKWYLNRKLTKKHIWGPGEWTQSGLDSLYKIKGSGTLCFSNFLLASGLLIVFLSFQHLCTLSSSHLREHMALTRNEIRPRRWTFYHPDASRDIVSINPQEALRFFLHWSQRLNRQKERLGGPPLGGGVGGGQQIISAFEILLITRLIIQSIPQTLLHEMSTLTFSIYCENFHFKIILISVKHAQIFKFKTNFPLFATWPMFQELLLQSGYI